MLKLFVLFCMDAMYIIRFTFCQLNNTVMPEDNEVSTTKSYETKHFQYPFTVLFNFKPKHTDEYEQFSTWNEFSLN